MDTKGPDVCSSLTADPEDTKVSIVIELIKLALMDCSNAELTLDSRNQRWALEKCASQRLECPLELGLAARDFIVKTNYTDIFLSCTLLGLDQASGTVNTDDQATGDLRIESSAVASFLRSL